MCVCSSYFKQSKLCLYSPLLSTGTALRQKQLLSVCTISRALVLSPKPCRSRSIAPAAAKILDPTATVAVTRNVCYYACFVSIIYKDMV